jgi:hypothetical protein
MGPAKVIQDSEMCGSPLGAVRLLGVAVRVGEVAPELFQPVRADERLEVTAAELQSQLPAIGAVKLVSPGSSLGNEMVEHDRTKVRAGALAQLISSQVQQVEEGKPRRTGRRPIHDARKAVVVDEQVPGPEVAVAEPARRIGQGALDAASKLPEGFLVLGEVLGGHVGVEGWRSRVRAGAVCRIQVAQKAEAVSRKPLGDGRRRGCPLQAALERPHRQSSPAGAENPGDAIRDEGARGRRVQGFERGSLFLDAAGGRSHGDAEHDIAPVSDDDSGAAEYDRSDVESPTKLLLRSLDGGLERRRPPRTPTADDNYAARKTLEGPRVSGRCSEARTEPRLGLPCHRYRLGVPESKRRPPSGRRPPPDRQGCDEAVDGPDGASAVTASLGSFDRHNRGSRVADEPFGRGDLHVRVVIDELGARRTESSAHLAVGRAKPACLDRQDRREPAVPRMGALLAVSLLHRPERTSALGWSLGRSTPLKRT